MVRAILLSVIITTVVCFATVGATATVAFGCLSFGILPMSQLMEGIQQAVDISNWIVTAYGGSVLVEMGRAARPYLTESIRMWFTSLVDRAVEERLK